MCNFGKSSLISEYMCAHISAKLLYFRRAQLDSQKVIPALQNKGPALRTTSSRDRVGWCMPESARVQKHIF